MSRLFVWVGFIMTVGLSAKLLTAFSDKQIGLLTVIFVGTIGVLISMLTLPLLYNRDEYQPISLIGFIFAVFTAFILMLFWGKLLRFAGYSK